MQSEVEVLLQNLLVSPDRFSDHLKRMAGAIIMMVTYGHRVSTDEDPFIQLAEEVRRTAEETPGAALVDTIPMLKYLPSWIAPFKRLALMSRELSVKMREVPFLMVKEQLAAGNVVRSMVSSLLEDESRPKDGSDEEIIKNCGGVVYSAGADTTATALTNFILAMALYPDVQRRAHEELDTFVGRSRLPHFDDREKLPYLSAILKETLRWKAVTPLGVPHCTTEADEYRGRHIPREDDCSGQYIVSIRCFSNFMLFISNRAMLHDPDVYEDPNEFNPDRFIAKSTTHAAPDPARAAFGFGRRICPGRYFADDSIWIAMSSILHVFSIDEPAGGIEESHIRWSSGLVRYVSCMWRSQFLTIVASRALSLVVFVLVLKGRKLWWGDDL
ncbi:Cytochrome P450 monooxygenase 67 [Mycena venus]|uniref:Cytochrome P450 monooxygenase 67 n=1 Tax=Mycena venus TaxID=2733690 RepID=A0A8H7D646_9AGAR|nr:Cytochrome P450 monooxygenase 67 [Mycena venus]